LLVSFRNCIQQEITFHNDLKIEIKQTENVRKSISADVNYGIRFANDQEMYKFTLDLSNEGTVHKLFSLIKNWNFNLFLK